MEAISADTEIYEIYWSEEVVKEFESYIDQNASDFVTNIRYDLRNKWDRIIIVTGERGVGKSTFAILLAKLIDYTFTFDRLAFTPEEIIPIFQTMNPYQCMSMDEGGEIWGKADWATKVSRTITKQVIGDRYLYACRFILAPTIFNLDKRAIDMAHFWIKVYSPDGRKRGYAEVRNMTQKDYFDKKLPFAPPIMEFEFDDLPNEIALQYEKYKAQKGRERSERYAKIIGEEIHGKAPSYLLSEKVAEDVTNDLKQFSTDDEIDWKKIYMVYNKYGLGIDRAKTIASYLNDLGK